ncbi:hypothetical protein [Streptomyces sp. NPDC057545]
MKVRSIFDHRVREHGHGDGYGRHGGGGYGRHRGGGYGRHGGGGGYR